MKEIFNFEIVGRICILMIFIRRFFCMVFNYFFKMVFRCIDYGVVIVEKV